MLYVRDYTYAYGTSYLSMAISCPSIPDVRVRPRPPATARERPRTPATGTSLSLLPGSPVPAPDLSW